MGLSFSAPGKTFLAGEYLALDGGLALLAMTEPRFSLKAVRGTGRRVGFPAGSPAARRLDRQADFFSTLDLEFVDPHAGAGGWGASTAQYLMVHALQTGGGAWNDEMENLVDTKSLLENYLLDAWDGQGRPPSGADLIGQMKGGLTFFSRQTGLIARGAWPFDNLDGYLIRTGVKLPTHEHLRSLVDLDTTTLAVIMTGLREAWSAADGRGFAEGIREYGRELQARGLVAETTLSLLHDLLWLEGVRAAKGCGAMGADVVFVLVDRSVRRSFQLWAADKGLSPIRLQDHVSGGLSLTVEAAVEMPAGGVL